MPLERLIPGAGDYEHDRLGGDTNAHARLRAAIIGPSVVTPWPGVGPPSEPGSRSSCSTSTIGRERTVLVQVTR